MALSRAAVASIVLALSLTARAETEVVPPSPVEMPEIGFPEGARAEAAVIDVEALLTVAASGEVTEVEVVRGAGEPFDAAVVAGARRFRFQPATMGGEAIEVRVPYVHHFVAPQRPAAPAEAGPKRDAVLEGIVQERGTRATPQGLVVVARVGAFEATAATDGQGRFRLELPAGEAELRVVDAAHKPFLQRETLSANESLRVKYLVDRVTYGGYESVVYAAKERTEVSRTTLTGRELTRIPGTFGDPFRVVTVLPGVTTVMSLLPYPIVRGSSPGNTGILLDNVRLPLLFHLFGGPAIVHPEFIERIDFYPGGFPVQYGGYTGGIIDGLTKRPSPEPRTELDLGLLAAGAYLRRHVDALETTVTLAGRIGYPGFLLSAISPTIGLSYWDYQARLDGKAGGGHWTVFAYGARDHLETGTQNEDGSVTMATALLLETHHLDLRWRTGDEDREKLARLVLLWDRSQSGTSSDTRAVGVQPQFRMRRKLADGLTFFGGLDASYRHVETTRSETAQKALAALGGYLQDDGIVAGVGAFAQLAWRPLDALTVIPGVRGDLMQDASAQRSSVDPRLLVRWRLSGGDGGGTTIKAVAGVYHQPPRLALPLPGADEAKLSYDLLASRQASLGAEVKLAPGLELDVQGYYNANSPVLFDLSTNQSLASILNEPPALAPGVEPPPVPRTNRTQEAVARLATPLDGRAYGVEWLLRKRDISGFFGWLAYTLSKSERLRDGAWVPFDFDRRHILNAVAGVKLPRNWEVGARVLLQTGTPVTNVHGYNAGRTAPQLRVDLRVDKRAVWNRWLLDFYVDVINATVSQESGGVVGGEPLRYVLPTIGVRAVL
jgi:TonB family protein